MHCDWEGQYPSLKSCCAGPLQLPSNGDSLAGSLPPAAALLGQGLAVVQRLGFGGLGFRACSCKRRASTQGGRGRRAARKLNPTPGPPGRKRPRVFA